MSQARLSKRRIVTIIVVATAILVLRVALKHVSQQRNINRLFSKLSEADRQSAKGLTGNGRLLFAAGQSTAMSSTRSSQSRIVSR